MDVGDVCRAPVPRCVPATLVPLPVRGAAAVSLTPLPTRAATLSPAGPNELPQLPPFLPLGGGLQGLKPCHVPCSHL